MSFNGWLNHIFNEKIRRPLGAFLLSGTILGTGILGFPQQAFSQPPASPQKTTASTPFDADHDGSTLPHDRNLLRILLFKKETETGTLSIEFKAAVVPPRLWQKEKFGGTKLQPTISMNYAFGKKNSVDRLHGSGGWDGFLFQ